MGIDYITHSFKVAAQTDPSARLYYNDFNIERCCNAKINATLEMLRTIKAAGAPVHGVGMQGHSRVGKSPSKREMKETMARFSDLVDEIAFTEVDIRHTKLPTTVVHKEQQARDYMEVVGACLETPKCVGITVWDFTDQVRTSTTPALANMTLRRTVAGADCVVGVGVVFLDSEPVSRRGGGLFV